MDMTFFTEIFFLNIARSDFLFVDFMVYLSMYGLSYADHAVICGGKNQNYEIKNKKQRFENMDMEEYRLRRQRAKRRRMIHNIMVITIGILIIIVLILGGIAFGKYRKQKKQAVNASAVTAETTPEETETTTPAPTEDEKLLGLLEEANRLALGYDYDKAIELLQSDPTYAAAPEVTEAIASYEATKSTLVRYNPQEVTHVFFHSLVIDTAKAFDGDSKETGYNQMMTTKSEFLKILQSMYDRGYVLVRIHDVAYETTDENGNPKFTYGDIMLPEGKRAFVMSQDDVCYYEYMDGDGFASRMIIGEDGYPTLEMKMDDGSVWVGDYDLVPILEKFVQEHPDFSYRGARAIIAFTGYNGILGYRTDASYKDTNPNYEEDRRKAAEVAQCLRDHGWELASHSWGHRQMGNITMEHLKTDSLKWESNVESLIGDTDILLYPFGNDIGSWKPYTDENERFTFLKSLGFRYFCNVDGAQYWMQLGQDHYRQGRRNLDGYRMYNYPDTVSDLFDAAEVFDPARPTPVPEM